MENIRYPIGKFTFKDDPTSQEISRWIDEIELFPQKLTAAVASLSNEQLDTPYREGGWTIRQVVHHIADSHLNGYTRVKLAITENQPPIKPYDQDAWAKLLDSQLPVEPSLKLIDGLHRRWSHVLNSLSNDELTSELVHPEEGTLTVKNLIGQYAWHGNHHLAHIENLKARKNWT